MTPFLKMHGLGNDFVVLDARGHALAIDAVRARALADRRRGIGCDQVVVIGTGEANATLTFYNADGTEIESCGNATRCVARLLMDEAKTDDVVLDTKGGRSHCFDAGGGAVTADMGAPQLDWDRIPLARPEDTNRFILNVDGASHIAASVNVGNPHCVLFVDDAEAAPVAELGARIETHPLFPERVNVEFATVRDRSHLRMRVWERGTGITLACGTGACAVAVAGHRRGLTERKVEIELDGGTLLIELRERDGHVLMTGPATLSYRGEIDLEMLGA